MNQWYSTIPPISTKQTTTSNHMIDTEKNITFVFENPGPFFRQAQKVVGWKKNVNNLYICLSFFLINCPVPTSMCKM